MKTTVGEREGNSIRLEIEVPPEDVDRGIDVTIKRLGSEIRVPGFRKGKVPSHLVVQRFGMEAIVHQMLDEHLSAWYATGLTQTEIEPVDRPEVDFEEAPERGRPFTFTALVTVMPVAELGDYKGIEAPREEVVVADAEVDEHVERLREQFGELKTVEGRPVAEGDFVSIDAKGYRDGEFIENTNLEDYMFEVGAGYLLPDLEAGIVGMEVGEERAVTVGFPDDYHAEELQGATLEFQVTVKETKEKNLPAMNDEFAKDASEFETLLELRLDIRKKLEAGRVAAVDRSFRAAVVQKVAQGLIVDIPPAAIENQAREMVEDFARSLSMQGGDIRNYLQATGTGADDLVKQMLPEAESAVRTTLALDAVAAAEGLEISEEQMQERLGKLATAGKVDPVELRSRLEESGRIKEIREQILRENAAQFLVENAVAVAPSEAEAVQPTASDEEPEQLPVDEGGPEESPAGE